MILENEADFSPVEDGQSLSYSGIYPCHQSYASVYRTVKSVLWRPAIQTIHINPSTAFLKSESMERTI
ncbi:hypothetical protein D1872_249220 [compost metagenome]